MKKPTGTPCHSALNLLFSWPSTAVALTHSPFRSIRGVCRISLLLTLCYNSLGKEGHLTPYARRHPALGAVHFSPNVCCFVLQQLRLDTLTPFQTPVCSTNRTPPTGHPFPLFPQPLLSLTHLHCFTCVWQHDTIAHTFLNCCCHVLQELLHSLTRPHTLLQSDTSAHSSMTLCCHVLEQLLPSPIHTPKQLLCFTDITLLLTF